MNVNTEYIGALQSVLENLERPHLQNATGDPLALCSDSSLSHAGREKLGPLDRRDSDIKLTYILRRAG